MGLDLSTVATGLVIVESSAKRLPRELVTWRVETATLIAPRSDVVEERCDAMISGILRNFGADLVAIEGIAVPQHQLGRHISLIKLHGVVERKLRELSMPYIVVPVKTWRMHLLGNGGIKKVAVRAAIRERYGYEHASLDVLEAWAVAVYACRLRQGLLLAPVAKPKRATRASRRPRTVH